MLNELYLYKGIKDLPKIFSKNEIETIISTVENSDKYLKNNWGEFLRARDKCIVLLLYSLGLRPKECLYLKFSDFKFNEWMVTIDGANNKERKSRDVPISKMVAMALREYLSFPRSFWRGSKYLFPSFEDKSRPLSPGRWKGILREKILKPAGLYEVGKTRSYTFRATKATELLENSKDPYLVASFLGHSDLRMLPRYALKTKSYQERVREELNKIPELNQIEVVAV